jgi:hypothetical protein
MLIALSAMEFIVLACYWFRSTFCTCGLPSGSSPEKFFENTRECGNGELKMISTRSCQKIFGETAQRSPLATFQVSIVAYVL